MSAQRTIPTVVVARRPVPGHEAEFEAWLRRLLDVARHAPGHVSSDLQPPNEVHPGEWVVLYQFTDAESLRAWLSSTTRVELMREAAHLVEGSAREQVIALDRPPEPVTGVASFRVKPGHEQRYAELHERLVGRLASFPGYLHSEVFAPVAGVQDDTVVVFSFDNRAHLDAWLGSAERREVLDEIAPVLEGDRTVNVVGGFAGWFGRHGADVKRWKQASVVLLALFPTSVVLTLVRRWMLPDVHWVVGVLFGNVLGVIVLSWALMPFLTRLLDGWLRR